MTVIAEPAERGRACSQALHRLSARLARAEGCRDAMRARADQLEASISAAKGRLERKGETEAFIEGMQSEASRRSLATFEALLTAIVQEVLPGEKPVTLDLSMERGLPSLDVCLVRPDGTREDVLEDNGGAVTNVVGMALRLIAVVKSGAARFLALDEADCWVAPERVTAFYRVIEDCAARLGVQCLAISHHDVSRFAGRFRVGRVLGEPATGVSFACPDWEAEWRSDAPGLRYVRLVDVQAYGDATLTLGPGVNALIGPNNRGKSTVIRALRAVFYGEARDSLVRAGATAARIEIGVARGRVLRFSRQPGRTPVNIWSLHHPDGSIVEEDGIRLESGGRAVPDWVNRMFGIGRVEQLDLHLAHQKFPVFLLGEPPSRRSAVLSIGREASYFRDMLAVHRERCTADTALVRNGERELTAVRLGLERFAGLAAISDEISLLHRHGMSVEAAASKQERLERTLAQLTAARAGLDQARRYAGRSADLPETAESDGLAAALAELRERECLEERLKQLTDALARVRARAEILRELPDELPLVRDSSVSEGLVSRLRALAEALAAAKSQMRSMDEELSRIRSEIATITHRTGGLCPTCGAPVDPAALLHDHSEAA